MKDLLFFVGVAILYAIVGVCEHVERIDCHDGGGRWVHTTGCSMDYCEEPKR
jgi:hypothetical protein